MKPPEVPSLAGRLAQGRTSKLAAPGMEHVNGRSGSYHLLIIGAVAGWLAGQIMSGGGFGLIGDIVIGIIGAFVAGLLLPEFSSARRHHRLDHPRRDRRGYRPVRGRPDQASLARQMETSERPVVRQAAAA